MCVRTIGVCLCVFGITFTDVLQVSLPDFVTLKVLPSEVTMQPQQCPSVVTVGDTNALETFDKNVRQYILNAFDHGSCTV